MTRSENITKLNKQKAENKYYDIYDLLCAAIYTNQYRLNNGNWNKSAISRALNIDIKTVRKYIPKIEEELQKTSYQLHQDMFEEDLKKDKKFQIYCEMMKETGNVDIEDFICRLNACGDELDRNDIFYDDLHGISKKQQSNKNNKIKLNRKKNKEAKKQRNKNRKKK